MCKGNFLIRICIFLVFLWTAETSFSQSKDPDSLLHILRTQDLSQKEKSKLLSLAAHYHQDIDSSLLLAKQSLQIAEDIQNLLLQAEALEEISHLERRLGNNPQSFQASLDALKIYESLKLTERQAASYTQLASNYISDENYALGIQYLIKARDIYSASNQTTNHALTILNLGEAYRLDGQLEKASLHFEEALQLNRSIENVIIQSYSQGNLGMVQLAQNLLDPAQRNLSEAINVLRELGDSYSVSIYLAELGKVHKMKGQPKFAEEKFLEALDIAKKNGLKEEIRDVSALLSSFYEAKEQYQEALQFQKMNQVYQDSLVNKENIQKVEQLKASYEIDKRESEIGLLNKINTNQKYIVILLALGLFSLLIFAYLLRRGNNRIKKANAILANQKDEIAKREQEKALLLRELNHRIKNNLQMISSLLSLQGHQLDGHPAQAALLEGQSRVEALSLVHRKLYQDGVDTRIKVKEYIEELVLGLFHGYGATFKPRFDIADINITIDKAIPLALIINEVIINSLKYAYDNIENPLLEVILKKTEQDDQINIQVMDNGGGFDILETQQNNSFGIRLVHSLIEQLGGSINTISGQGAHWNMLMKIA
ncbi:sensor histidine kinase [Flagellimonas nanhaiensis]|uniref:histidine kinase n=1 Tax=Flagellimonas nanhaiensis TaxID=2292706 RepID=A0A371JRA0_9FLAO|nr:histidine kinase dimerization/phosphoacceptor domain -containing protein [Allomuricauda nanhaiensis]RDY60051.1 histidine kinase [Allomuricauda nanhaiensis]